MTTHTSDTPETDAIHGKARLDPWIETAYSEMLDLSRTLERQRNAARFAETDLLQPVWEDGYLLRTENLADIRKRVQQGPAQ